MRLDYSVATGSDAAAIAAVHTAVAERLTRDFGHGPWSFAPTEHAVLSEMRRPPEFSRTLIGRADRLGIVATLRLATKKPWAIDAAYFTPVAKPLYLTGMAVHPDLQRRGIGRDLLLQAEAIARDWKAGAIRLDAFDADAGAAPFYAKCGYREVARVAYKSDPLVYFELVWAAAPPCRARKRAD